MRTPAPLLALLVALSLLPAGCGGERAAPRDLLAEELAGIALLERYDEADMERAVKVLRGVVEAAPDWREARVHLALALAGTHHGPEMAEALALYEGVLAEDPGNPWALFQTALVHRFQGRPEAAVPYLERCLAVDPDDPGVHYWLGTLALERTDEDVVGAEAHLRRAHALAPDEPSMVYGLFTALVRQGKGDTEEAQGLLAKFRGLEEAKDFGSGALQKHVKRGQTEYGEAGRYALAIRDLAAPAGPVFSVAPDAAGLAGAAAGLACGDLDGDGDDDLVLVGGPGGAARWRHEHGRFADATAGAGLAGVVATTALLGDLDDDGVPDLATGGPSGVALWRNGGASGFAAFPAGALPPAAAGAPVEALSLADLDHDGDLDVLSAGPACGWWRNRRDGGFSDATAERGVGGAASTVVAFDADGDTVEDLVRFGPAGPPVLLRNGRLAPFSRTAAADALGEAVSGTVGDADGDGRLDLVLVRPDGRVALARGDGRGAFALDATFPTFTLEATAAAVADFDLDGRPDVLAFGRRVTLLRGLPSGGFRPGALALPARAWRAAALLDLEGDGDLDVVLVAADGAPAVLVNATPPARRGLVLRLRGVPDRVEGRTWTNVLGVGADVEAKAGERVARAAVLAGSGFPGQASGTLVLGLGAAARADFVRVRWPDGVLQSEAEVPTGTPREIVEVNRKLASCPVLFGWTGEAFTYATDTLGAGGLGFYVGGPDGYAPPDPTEVVRLPALSPRDGAFLVSLVENLEEVAYLDEARLLVVDHDAAVVVHPDERFAVEAPWPTGRFQAFAEAVAPVAATDGEGRDVLASVLAQDRRYPASVVPDRRFLGFATGNTLVLDFGDRLASVAPGERLVLVLAGWIEYAYGRTVAAAAQAGLAMEPPVLEVEDGRGGWRKALGVGYPAGNPRTMTCDVTGVLGPRATRCRLRTNLEVHWDQVTLARDLGPAAFSVTEVPAASAALSARGYPREYSPDGAAPTLYDLSVCEAWIPYRTIPGAYTRFGDVTPLVTAADDRFVVFSRGEEVLVRFDAARLPPPAPGRARSFFVRLDGYCKDRDPYTGAGDAVEPLPFHAMSNYPFPASERGGETPALLEERARWNTRRVR